jgi:3',5'-cyclic AMP phosphodiesterase CpdA
MKRLLLASLVVGLFAAALGVSQSPTGPTVPTEIQVKSEARNPWTHLRFPNGPGQFQFAVVSDRTGGHREKVFSRAVEQLNLMMPRFVVSVGDLIEGGNTDQIRLANEWREFQSFVGRLKMPFFYVPGNHDVSNETQEAVWKEKFGRRYYHFQYENVLFLLLNSDDPPRSSSLSAAQIAYFRDVLKSIPAPAYTLVFLHKPIWAAADLKKNGWEEFESLLLDRPYTVFAGHVHRYQKFVRHGRNYYQLATTGGGSKLRGVQYGEFDHIVWVTMTPQGPVLANVLLDGILPENLVKPETTEPVVQYNRRPTFPVKGQVYLRGVPLANAMVVFHAVEGERAVRTGDGVTEADGSFGLSTYTAFDGVPVGEYVVTVSTDLGNTPGGEPRPGLEKVPERYRRPGASPLRAKVGRGPNTITLELE